MIASAPASRARSAISVIGALLIVLAGLFGWWITRHGPPGFDRPVIAALAGLRAHADVWLAVTALGDGWFRIAVILMAAGWLVRRRDRRDALILILATGGEMLGNSVLKLLFARARPDVLAHLDPVSSYSYPSGHSAHSATLYLLLALLLTARRWPIVAALLLAGAIGTSRIVLGVHWPSDVIGGWAVGIGVALIGWSFRRPNSLHD